MSAFSQLRNGRRRSLGAGYWLLLTLLGLPLISPLLRWTSGPCTHDGHLHYHRLAAMRYAWENGLVLSRWLPDVAFGYGYPFFLFREAVPLYLSLMPHLLGLPLPASIGLLYGFSLLASGWFMFLWVRDIFGPVAGLVSAVAYMTAPYQLIDALVRGNQPESLALLFFPLICWAGRRFMLRGTAPMFLIAVLSLALLALSHNISTLLFVPFLILYLLLIGWLHELKWRALLVRLLVIIVLGLGLSSLYLGPALLELDQITISQSVNNRNNDFRFNFASPEEVLAPVAPNDPGLLNPPLLIRLGWVQSGLAVLGLLSFFWARSRERRGHILFMALAALGLLFMSLAASQALWERLPLIEFVQFPWRLIGRAALPVAFLAGIPFAILPRVIAVWRPGRAAGMGVPLLIAAALTLLLLEALPNLYPHVCQAEARPTINKVHDYERNSGMVGVDPTGSYFPTTVLIRPEGSPLETDYQEGRAPQRFDGSALPAGATITDVYYQPVSARAIVDSPEPFEARYLTFAFPGWVASVDGKTVPVEAGGPEGLITFLVPAGRHAIEVKWQMTPTRTIMTAFSVLALASIAVTATILWLRGKDAASAENLEIEQRGTSGNQRQITRAFLATLALLAIVFLLFKLFVVDRVPTPFRREAPAPVAYTSELTAAEMHLQGYNLDRSRVAAGDAFNIDLAWQVNQTPAAEYQSNVWLVGPDGQTWSDKETVRPRTFSDVSPTNFWLPGQWAWDSREVQVLAGTPPGSYDIVLTLFDLATLQPITLSGRDARVIGPSSVIGQLEVTSPRGRAEFEPQYPYERELAGLNLLGYSQDRQEAMPGDPLLLTLFWEKVTEEPAEDELSLRLVDQAGRTAQNWSVAPVGPSYLPDQWALGERLRGQHSLRLVATLESGLYTFVLEDEPLGQISIQAPDRLVTPPPYATAVQANFDSLIELTGYSLKHSSTDAAATLTLSLVWKGLAEMPINYRVFIHLLDESGQILAQSDAEPAGWTRPTTGWSPGEYVVDEHQLTLPSGSASKSLRLKIGLYDATTGNRLTTDQRDSVLLPIELE